MRFYNMDFCTGITQRIKLEQELKEVVIFARVSSTGDRQDYQRQVNDLTEYATRNGMRVKRVFAEKVSGGKRNEEREELMNMIAYVKEHKVKKVLTSELSRVGRNTLQVLKTIEVLNENGISLFIQNYGIETLTDEGRVNPMSQLLVTILAEIAQMERKTIQERMTSGYRNYRENGGKVGRKEGYRKDEEKLLAEYVEEVKLLKKNYSLRNVAKITGRSVSTIQKIKLILAKSNR